MRIIVKWLGIAVVFLAFQPPEFDFRLRSHIEEHFCSGGVGGCAKRFEQGSRLAAWQIGPL